MQTSTSSQPSQPSQPSEFFVNWEDASVHVVLKSGEHSNIKADFAIKLTGMIEAGSNTGYMALVKRRINMQTKYVSAV